MRPISIPAFWEQKKNYTPVREDIAVSTRKKVQEYIILLCPKLISSHHHSIPNLSKVILDIHISQCIHNCITSQIVNTIGRPLNTCERCDQTSLPIAHMSLGNAQISFSVMPGRLNQS